MLVVYGEPGAIQDATRVPPRCWELAAGQELACVLYFVAIDVAVTPVFDESLVVVAGLYGFSPLLEEAAQFVVTASELYGLKDARRPGLRDLPELALCVL